MRTPDSVTHLAILQAAAKRAGLSTLVNSPGVQPAQEAHSKGGVQATSAPTSPPLSIFRSYFLSRELILISLLYSYFLRLFFALKNNSRKWENNLQKWPKLASLSQNWAKKHNQGWHLNRGPHFIFFQLSYLAFLLLR